MPIAAPVTKATLLQAISEFHREPDRLRGHHSSSEPCEIVSIRVTGAGKTRRPAMAPPTMEARPVVSQNRSILLEPPWGVVECKVFRREQLVVDSSGRGQAIIEDMDATTLDLSGSELDDRQTG